ncbi:MAG: tRNA 2-thiouridine(34) synthase MnmA, partial [bacterium]|nr:tRNA 2-thiouridine(34) synthase MnmA [bacterium]
SAIEPQTNTIRVDLKEKLFFADVWVNDLNWISIPRLDKEMQVTVKLRSAHTGAPAMLYPEEESVRIKFDEPQFAPSPGQSAVFYDDAIVVGGGIII